MLGRVGRRKKCFQLPIRCFKLLLRDAMAVIDPDLRVHGIAGLCVADAAIMPTVVSGHTNAATIMRRGLPIWFVRICGSRHDFSRRERCTKLLQAIISQQGEKPDDRENCKIRQ
jgi:hypothetical protein